ncbi:hypothetical protein DYGSA30_36220 [Dyella sp. GSA-30]|nr:hypothetical protein DYGSA30_36220 [Dyella sp. GSA-30]
MGMVLLCLPERSLASTHNHGPVVQRLANDLCQSNLDVYAPKKDDASTHSGDCVLGFTDVEETGAVMRLNGINVPLRVIHKSTGNTGAHYDFADSSGKVIAVLDVKMNCQEGVEGCDFSGSLTIRSSGAKARIHVVYYRGG